MKHRIVIPYFSRGLQYIMGPMFFIGAVYLFWSQFYIGGLIIILIGASLVTSRYITEVDQKKKQIRDFVEILFIPLNLELYKYDQLRSIGISKDNHAYTANTRSRERQVNFSSYIALLLYDDKELEILTKNSYEDLKKLIEPLAKKLNLQIEKHV